MRFDASIEHARALDAKDPLRGFRNEFYVRPDRLYFDGNSLGLLCKDAEAAVESALSQWKVLGIDGWLDADPPWFSYGELFGALMAELVGAAPDEVVVASGTTVNLHALALAFLKTMPGKKVLADRLNFPSDLYALAGDAELLGRELVLVDSEDGRFLDEEKLIKAMTPDIGLAIFPSVLYRSGQLLDMAKLAKAAHERGIILGFDCCHSAGVVPHSFDEWGVDFAFWCNYKYLNGGPGSTASLYVNRRHSSVAPALRGWWGHEKSTQFDMNVEYERAGGAAAFQIGTPSVLGTAAVFGAAKTIQRAGLGCVREKSLAATAYLMGLIDEVLAPHCFSAGTPREDSRRGGHVALEHADAWRICAAIKKRGVIPDFRPPDVIRLAPVPLYISFEEIWRTVDVIRDSYVKSEHLMVPKERGAVT